MQVCHLGRNGQLAIPLGKWSKKIENQNGFFLDPIANHQYKRQDDKWFIFTRMPGKTRTLSYHRTPRSIQEHDKPSHLHRAQIHNTRQKIILQGAAPINTTTEDGVRQTTKVEEEWGIQTQLEGNEDILINVIWQGIALAVSNGSFQNQAGAAVWTIESATKENRMVGHGRTPGSATDQSAYRSELFGLWGIFYTLTQLTDTHKLQEGRITVACDGLSALQQAQRDNPTDPTLAHYDIIGAIRMMKSKLRMKINLEHVRGHQDGGIIMVLTIIHGQHLTNYPGTGFLHCFT